MLSPPQAALYARGYTEIVNVDYSAVVIRKMAARHAANTATATVPAARICATAAAGTANASAP